MYLLLPYDPTFMFSIHTSLKLLLLNYISIVLSCNYKYGLFMMYYFAFYVMSELNRLLP